MATRIKLIDTSLSPTLAGATFTGHLDLGDNDKIRFGDSDDYQIHHNANGVTYVAGSVVEHNSNTWRVKNLAGTETLINASADNAVDLYYNGSKKLETTTTGVLVTGELESTTLDVNGAGDISGNLAVGGNLTLTGNLSVNGTTTTLSTATLDVEDKNITLNKGSGDTSASADGAGITIQDAVDASNDASLTWNAANDQFVFSHKLIAPRFIQSSSSENTFYSAAFSRSGSGTSADVYGTNGTLALGTDASNTKLVLASTGVTVTGTITSSGNIEAQGTRTIATQFDSQNYMRIESNNNGGVLKGLASNVTGIMLRSYGDSFFLNKVGIGNTAPLGKLTISNAAGGNAPTTVTAANTYLQLGSDDYGASNNGKFMIGLGYTDATNTNSPAYIGFEETSTSGDTKGNLTFYTRDVITDTAPTLRMRVSDAGKVHIGDTAASNAQFRVKQTTNSEWAANFINHQAVAYGLSIDTLSSTSYTTYSFAAYTPQGSGFSILNNSKTGVGVMGAAQDGQLHVRGTTNKTLKLDPTFSSGTYTTLAFARNGTDKWRIFHPSDDSYLSFYNDQASLHNLGMSAAGDVMIGSTTVRKDLSSSQGPTLSIEGAFPALNLRDTGGTAAFYGVNGDAVYVGGHTSTAVLNSYVNGNVATELRSDRMVVCANSSEMRIVLGSTGNPTNNTANWIRGSGSTVMYNSASGDHRWEVGGTEKMRLYATGEVTKPANPAFRAYTSTEWTSNGIISSGWNDSQYSDGRTYDIAGNFNVSNGRFTAPRTGVYLFTVMWDSNGSQAGLSIMKNTTITLIAWEPTGRSDDAWESKGYSTTVKLTANDFVQLKTVHASGSYPVHMGGAYWGHFSGVLLG